MFKTQSQFTNSLFGSYAYDPIINRNQDHILVKMNKIIDWSFVEQEVAKCYSVKGQNAIHPLRMFKMLVVQNYFNLSERETVSNADCNIIYRYFIGLGLTDEVPHWTELGKFKARIGVDVFERLFYRILTEAERLGIKISNKRNADATDIRADVDLQKCRLAKQNKDDHQWIDRQTTDPEADFGHKKKNKIWYGYKSHTNQEVENELITAVITTKASVTDESQLVPLIDKEIEMRGDNKVIRKQGGDKGFVGHTEELAERDILDYVIPKDNMKIKAKKDKNKHYLHLKKLRYKVEQKFAEAKKKHGLRKAKYRGRWKVHLQCLLTYLVMNLKRIVNLLIPRMALNYQKNLKN